MARYPARSYVHQYGDLTVTVKYIKGAYVAFLRRPSDGYEVGLETSEYNPIDAARYALGYLADLWKNPGQKSIHPKLSAAAKEIGQEAAEALEENPDPTEESPQLSGPYDESGHHREGDVWFQVVHEPKDLKPGQWVEMPFRGRKFRTKEDAEAALILLLNQGTIKPDEKDQWGVERARQGKGRTEVYRVRVS